MKVLAINQKSTLLPGAEVSLPAEEHLFAIIQTYDSLQVTNHHTTTTIDKRSLLLIKSCKKRIRLINQKNKPIVYRTILFHANSIYWPHKKVMLFSLDTNESILVSAIQSVFNNVTGINEAVRGLKKLFRRNDNQDRDVKNKIAKKINSNLIKINRYIRNNYNQQISLNDLCNIINCSPTYLSNTYKRIFNISPIYYLNKIRINKARELLMNSSLTINEIAQLVGYSSSSQFCSIFKRYMSETPTDFRKKGIL